MGNSVKRNYNICFILIVLLFHIFSCELKAQFVAKPAAIDGIALWKYTGSNESIINNYRTIDLLDSSFYSAIENIQLDKAFTCFLVVDLQNQPNGRFFGSIGNLNIYDTHIEYGRAHMDLNFVKNIPKILTFQSGLNSPFAKSTFSDIKIYDHSIFNLAELIVFPRMLNREEIRKINTILGLKYSITITKVSDEDWRDYLKYSGGDYWNKKIDKVFNNRVIGLGRSDKQGLYQTQTKSNETPYIQVSLGSIALKGEMPPSNLSDEAYIILSERDSSGVLSNSCSVNSFAHPLERWRLRTDGVGIINENLIVGLFDVPKSSLIDTLFLFDGNAMIPLESNIVSDDYVYYQIAPALLERNGRYEFRTRATDSCLKSLYEVDNDEFHLVGLDNDSIIGEVIPLNNPWLSQYNMDVNASVHLEEGCYVLNISDASGDKAISTIIRIGERDYIVTVENDKAKLFPNPVSSFDATFLRIELNDYEGNIHIVVTDPLGRVVSDENLIYNSASNYPLVMNSPGLYTVIVAAEKRQFILKLIVTTRK